MLKVNIGDDVHVQFSTVFGVRWLSSIIFQSLLLRNMLMHEIDFLIGKLHTTLWVVNPRLTLHLALRREGGVMYVIFVG